MSLIYIYDKDERLQLILNNTIGRSRNPQGAFGKPAQDYTHLAGMYIGGTDSDDSQTEGQRHSSLENRTIPYQNGWFKEQLNGCEELDFEVIADNPEAELIEEDGRAVIRNSDGDFMEFIIRIVEDVDDSNGTFKMIHGEGCEYELIDEWISQYKAESVTLKTALTSILQFTRWEVGNIDDFGEHSVDLRNMSVKAGIYELIKIFGGERKNRVDVAGNQVINRYLDVLENRGTDTGKRFEAGKDVVSTNRTIDSSGIKTALYGYGASGENDAPRITFADVEWSMADGDPMDKPLGQTWLGDPDALQQYGYSQGSRHRFGSYSGQEGDPAELLMNTWKKLLTVNKANETYEFDVIMLEEMTGYAHEKVRLGDRTIAINRRIYPEVLASNSVIEFSQNLNDRRLSEVILGNYRREYDTSGKINDIERVVDEGKGSWDDKPTKDDIDDAINDYDDVFTDDFWEDFNDEMDDVFDQLDKDMKESKQDAEDAFDRANEAVDKLDKEIAKVDEDMDAIKKDAIESFDKANDAFDKSSEAMDKAQEGLDLALDNGVTVKDFGIIVGDLDADFTSLAGTVDGFRVQVGNAEGDASEALQTVDGFRTTVNNAKGDASEALQTVDGFRTTVNDAYGNASSALQTVEGFRQTVSDADGNASSALQTAKGLISDVSDAKGNASEAIQIAEGFRQRVSNAEGDASSAHQIATGLQSTVSDNEGNISKVTNTANAVVTRVGKAEDDIGALGLGVASAVSQISVMKDNINLRVRKGDVISQINLNDKGRVYIEGKQIQLDGNTSIKGNFKVDGHAVINRGSIRSAQIDSLNVNQLTGSTITGKKIKTAHSKNYIHMKDQVLDFWNGGHNKMTMGFNTAISTALPYIVMGAGDGTESNKMYFNKLPSSFEMTYNTTGANDRSKIKMAYDGDMSIGANNNLYLSTQKSSGRVIVDRDFVVHGGGRVQAQSIRDVTTSGSPNVYVATNGFLARSNSSRRTKMYEKDVSIEEAHKLLDAKPTTWFDKGEVESHARYLNGEGDDSEQTCAGTPYIERYGGLIAEDIESIGLSRYVTYGSADENGNRDVEGIQYDRLWTLLIPLVRNQEERILKLEEMLKNE